MITETQVQRLAGPPNEFPIGWFQIAWAAELGAEDVIPLRYFAKDLVLFRSESGAATVLDGHCGHMGAHLGHGGKVVGETIKCPFHGWQWGTDGRCAHIPYGDRRTIRASIRSWPVREVGSIIYIWHHPTGEAPTWEPPTLEEETSGRFYPVYPQATVFERDVRFWPQLMAENQADAAHIAYVHKWPAVPNVLSSEFDGHRYRTVLAGEMGTTRGVTEEKIDVEDHGLGIVVGRMFGVADMCNLMCTTPIDAERSDARLSVFVERAAGDNGDELSNVAKAIVRAQHREVLTAGRGDRQIFENISRMEHPLTLSSEREVQALRRWAKQFYVNSNAGPVADRRS